MKLYTKKGDNGQTRTLNHSHNISKASNEIKLLGVLDEVNSYLGIIQTEINQNLYDFDESLVDLIPIQKQLFQLGFCIGNTNGYRKSHLGQFITDLEFKIDKMDEVVPKLNNFILPGGHPIAAKLHYARTLVRRAETIFCDFKLDLGINNWEAKPILAPALVYINRLSDFLFQFGRYINYLMHKTEISI